MTNSKQVAILVNWLYSVHSRMWIEKNYRQAEAVANLIISISKHWSKLVQNDKRI